MARLYPMVAEEIRTLVTNHKKGVAIGESTIRNFHKKDTLDSLRLWVAKQRRIVMGLVIVERENRGFTL